MRKTSQNIILYFICILGGLILSVISRNIYLQNQQKLLDNKEDTQYKQYLEEYVKSNGTVDRIFSENPPIQIELLWAEYTRLVDLNSGYDQREYWEITLNILNLSKKTCSIYECIYFDYLIDGVWYLCNVYDPAVREDGIYPLEEGKSVNFYPSIAEPTCRNNDLPFFQAVFGKDIIA